MKIGFLSVFYPYRGGIAQFNANLFRQYEKEHQIIAWNFSRQYPGLLFPGKSQFVEESDSADAIPSRRTLDTVNPVTWLKTAADIKNFKPDVLFTRFWMPFFSPSLGTVAAAVKKTGAKTIALLDNVLPHEHRPGDDTLIRYYLRRHDGFIVMTRAVKNQLRQFVPQARSLLKPHPIYSHFGETIGKAKARAALSLPKSARLILFFGFIRQYKGLDLLIESLPKLPQDYHLLIAGECYGDYAHYVQQIDRLGLHSRVHQIIRYVDDAKVSLIFSAADLCVLPYRSATQSGIAQIAWNFNLPLLVTPVGGLAEMVENGETGLVLPDLHAQTLAENIKYYFENDLKKRFAENMAERRHRYSWQTFAEKTIEFAESL